MSAVVLVSTQIAAGSWRLVPQVSVGTVVYWWEDGVLVDASDLPFRQLDLAAGESVRVEAFDSASDAPVAAFPGRVNLGWDGSAGATAYRVDRWIGAAWDSGVEELAGGRSYFRYTSPVLADCTEHRFRIVPIGVNAGAGREVAVYVIRRPDAVAATFSYVGGVLSAVF